MKKSVYVLLSVLISSCSFLIEKPVFLTTEERDNMFPTSSLPLENTVKIYWNDYRVPFIEAENDSDLAFALGLVHAHLRINQMELLKYVAHGRLSEIAGPFTVDFDKTIRMFQFDRAVDEIIDSTPTETKIWISRFLEGINFYIKSLEDTPPDLKAVGIELKEWTMKELLTTWRLAAIDVNWINYISFLNLYKTEGSEKLWEKLIELGTQGTPSFEKTDLSMLGLFGGKSGSNSFVVSGKKTNTGAALIANDPHLGIFLPNVWLLVGIKSPNYHAVGYSIPSLPFIALGRNENISWGGTNMRTLSSHIYKIPKDELNNLDSEEQEIKVRSWFNSSVTRRYSDKYGAVISDSPLFESDFAFSLKWVGHKPSDEISSFLNANKARNFEEFRNAFKDYAVSAQNLLFADNKGNIGQILAFRQPILPNPKLKKMFMERDNLWVGFKNPTELPFGYNPQEGFIASANNLPVKEMTNAGWFYSPSDRINRLNSLLSEKEYLVKENLMEIQLDVYSESSDKLNRFITEELTSVPKDSLSNIQLDIISELSNWDGKYLSGSRGPVAFEILFYYIADEYFSKLFNNEDLVSGVMRGGYSKEYLFTDFQNLDKEEREKYIVSALVKSEEPFTKFKNWGEMHRMEIGHPLANIPIIGNRWKIMEYGVDGGNEVIHKTAFGNSPDKNRVFYGANARHISDMSDLDENYFVLLGGQDGWLLSPQTADQVELWRKGKFMKIPLRIETVKREFKKVMVLSK